MTLTAKPNAGSVFTGWALASCSEAFPLIEDTTCTANFDILNPFGDVDPASWAYGYIVTIQVQLVAQAAKQVNMPHA